MNCTINIDCNSNLKKSDEGSKLYTKLNRKQLYRIVKVRKVMFFNVKIEKFVGSNSRQSVAFLVSGILGGGI